MPPYVHKLPGTFQLITDAQRSIAISCSFSNLIRVVRKFTSEIQNIWSIRKFKWSMCFTNLLGQQNMRQASLYSSTGSLWQYFTPCVTHLENNQATLQWDILIEWFLSNITRVWYNWENILTLVLKNTVPKANTFILGSLFTIWFGEYINQAVDEMTKKTFDVIMVLKLLVTTSSYCTTSPHRTTTDCKI